MATDNPAFRNQAFQGGAVAAQHIPAEALQDLYDRPSAGPRETDRMTVEDTIVKSAVSFGLLLVVAAATFWVGLQSPGLALLAGGVGGLVAFVLAMVNIFKKKPSGPLVLAYAGFEGLLVGGLSAFFEVQYPGVVLEAVLATLVVTGVTLALFASGKIRASARATKIFLIAMVGYAVFSLVNFGLQIFNVTDSQFGLRDMTFMGIPLGIVLGIVVVLLAAYSLVLDFDMIQQGVRNGLPRAYGWTGAFGVMVTVVWLYLELLRMFAIARD